MGHEIHFPEDTAMFKDLLVPITDTPGDAAAIAAAAAIAGPRQARVAVLEFVNLPMPVSGPWATGDLALGDLYATFQEQGRKDAQAWRDKLAQLAPEVSAEVRLLESFVADGPSLAAEQARYADVTILPMVADARRDGASIRAFFASVLLESGRPVLLVPAQGNWREPRHAVVSWRPTSEAARALHDALPLLRDTASVDVVVVGQEHDAQAPNPGDDIAAHLARHGVNARAVSLVAPHERIAATLLGHAQASAADLIVAGGYGHSRFREWMMGGVTADLLANPGTIPILFSH
ncbi:MAG: universal stress protein [Proteobacteria bacterium]|nr:universal stress protein [Pseudomonadota bacterium]